MAHAHKHFGAEKVVTGEALHASADKKITINNSDVTLSGLEKKLRDIYEQRKDKKLFVSAAGTLRYKEIIEVIDAARAAGVDKVGIVTEGMKKAAGVGN